MYLPEADGELKTIYAWKPGQVPAPTELTREKTLRRRADTRSGGQGRQADPRIRRAVEMRAMEVAREYYERHGYSVEDTSLQRSYDYLASRSGENRRVEVKGLQGAGDSVTVTAGEVNAALAGPETTDLFAIRR